MNCKAFEERVYDLCDGELNAAEERAMLSHAAGCANCTRLLNVHRDIVQQLRSLPRVAPPPETTSVVMAAIRERERRLFREKALQWSSVAAMAVAGMLAFLFQGSLVRSASTVGTQIQENATTAFQRISSLFSESITSVADGANNVLALATSSLPSALSQSLSTGTLALLFAAGLAVVATNYRLLREVAQD